MDNKDESKIGYGIISYISFHKGADSACDNDETNEYIENIKEDIKND